MPGTTLTSKLRQALPLPRFGEVEAPAETYNGANVSAGASTFPQSKAEPNEFLEVPVVPLLPLVWEERLV